MWLATKVDAAAAHSLYEKSLETFRQLGDRWGIAGSLADLGNLARDQGNFNVAHSLYRESMKMFQALDHKRGVPDCWKCFACSAAASVSVGAFSASGGRGRRSAPNAWRSTDTGRADQT